VACCVLIFGCATGARDPDYRYYVAGNPDDVVTETRGLLVMQGGGTDVDINYQRMGEFAGGGDFLVLRASGDDDYNEYIYKLCNCDSVETIVVDSRDAAYERFVARKIRRAEALFIAGGDQSNYVRFWKGTAVEDAIHFVAAKPAPIGGTSAGMAVMGQFSYSAMSPESLTAAVALSNPFHVDLTLERDFLNLAGLENVITDQHLIERDRIGRTVAILARLLHDDWTSTGQAIAADRETSVHLDPATGIAEIFSTATHSTPYVYFMRSLSEATVCEPEKPLSIQDVSVYRVAPGGTFDLKNWTGTGGLAYTFSVNDGQLISSTGEIY
jgi:cyanophycinase-like exopeptidase